MPEDSDSPPAGQEATRLRYRCMVWIYTAVLGLQSSAMPAKALELVTREQAVAAALSRGSRLARSSTDTLGTAAALRAARRWENPTLVAEYTKSAPQVHVSLDVPLDALWQRAPRIRAATHADSSSRAGFELERAAVRFEVETAYIRALAAHAHAALSRRSAQEADSLMRMAILRREAGDAGDLEVDLALVSAGEMANEADDDSAAAVTTVLDLQQLMGLGTDSLRITLADSLVPPAAPDTLLGRGTPLAVTAATSAVRSAEEALTLERRRVIGLPDVQVGIEAHDPSGSEAGILPLVGITLPLPLFHANGPAIDAAVASRERARADLEHTRRESAAAIHSATRGLALAFTKVNRDMQLRHSADHVAAMALVAYSEGAVALPAVLEAKRTARSALAHYIDDVASAAIADVTLRFVSTSTLESR